MPYKNTKYKNQDIEQKRWALILQLVKTILLELIVKKKSVTAHFSVQYLTYWIVLSVG